MNRIFRISGAGLLAGVSSLVFAPVSMPVLAQTPTSQSIICQPSTVAVAPSSGNLVVTCTSPDGTTPPPSCLVSVSPKTLPSTGGAATVTANCGTISSWAGTSPTTAVSTANGQTPIPLSFIDNLPVNSTSSPVSYTYTVVGANGTNNATVVVSGTSGGGGGGTTSCGTTPCLGWGDATHWQAGVGAPFNIPANGSFTVQFTVPAGLTGTTRLLTQFTGSNNRVNWTLASAPGVLPNPDPILKTIPFMSSQGYVWTIAIGGTSSSWLPALQPGGTYYINVQNPQNNAVSFYVKIG